MCKEEIEDYPVPVTIYGVVREREIGHYTQYVVENLDSKREREYILLTRYPNWIQGDIQIGDKGYFTYMYIFAGVSKWYDKNSGDLDEESKRFFYYNSTHLAFIKFIPDSEDIYKKKDEKLIVKIN